MTPREMWEHAALYYLMLAFCSQHSALLQKDSQWVELRRAATELMGLRGCG